MLSPLVGCLLTLTRISYRRFLQKSLSKGDPNFVLTTLSLITVEGLFRHLRPSPETCHATLKEVRPVRVGCGRASRSQGVCDERRRGFPRAPVHVTSEVAALQVVLGKQQVSTDVDGITVHPRSPNYDMTAFELAHRANSGGFGPALGDVVNVDNVVRRLTKGLRLGRATDPPTVKGGSSSDPSRRPPVAQP